MGREVSVDPYSVDQHKSDMQTSINGLQESATLNKNEMGESQLDSITKYNNILTQFEEALTAYITLVENDLAKVNDIKEKMIEEDTRLADWRMFK